ncbi:protein arginine kinase [Haloferula luteola]|uniref:Protein-arginine kinase n=1 Tax=Haloferula luteola TaxID=595692 RepID=A0A840V9R8_9BACT|nr:protein arginine kinase [Haloferula luteola]MBB5352324.1 protein arginine kinase [Haloferula luteola]
MMRFSTLIKHPADWMTGGNVDNSIVLTSRIRLARNLAHHPFPGWARKEQRQEVMGLLQPAVESLSVMKDCFSKQLSDLDSVHKQVMVERHLISREHAARGEGSAAVIERRQSFAIMINEEDHLRMQAIRPGLDLQQAFSTLSDLDDKLADEVEYAFDGRLGYLTTCPTNLGTGMRASAMLHLPALVLSDQIGQVLQAVNKIGLAVRGIFGEGSESLGHLFQISNQSTLGESEQEILDRLIRVISQVEKNERYAREKLLEEDPDMVRDKVGRAYGMLRHAWLISSKEALEHVSMIRLGVDLGAFPEDTARICDELLMDIQPAHLQLHSGRKLSPEERDVIRGEIVRSRLQSLEAPDTGSLENQNNGEIPPPDLGLA